MEHIRQAVELAKARAHSTGEARVSSQTNANAVHPGGGTSATPAKFFALSTRHLEANRIIAHNIADFRSRAYDILRTQVLQTMDTASWNLLATTSPTPDCGKTVTAINLALSIARHPERPVLLLDFDLQRPRISRYLGLSPARGALSLLEGRATLADTIMNVRVADSQMTVLPCENATLRSSELFASRVMATLLQEIRRDFKGYTVVIDLPPILAGDETISLLPQIDCVLFVAAAGKSRLKEVKDCVQYLDSTPVVRVVLNKANEAVSNYYSRYAEN